MKRTRATGVALVAAALLFNGSGVAYAAAMHAPPSAHPRVKEKSTHLPTKRQIAALFHEWNAALATGDANCVADLYAPDAVLLPTASPFIRTTRAGIVDYFEHFLQREPQAVIQRQIIDILGPTSAVNTGLYRFTLTMQDGSKTTLDARFTFVYERRWGKWLIINHHSSVVPLDMGWMLSGRDRPDYQTRLNNHTTSRVQPQ